VQKYRSAGILVEAPTAKAQKSVMVVSEMEGPALDSALRSRSTRGWLRSSRRRKLRMTKASSTPSPSITNTAEVTTLEYVAPKPRQRPKALTIASPTESTDTTPSTDREKTRFRVESTKQA